jgi:hypothetical protein
MQKYDAELYAKEEEIQALNMLVEGQSICEEKITARNVFFYFEIFSVTKRKLKSTKI